jgi:hypothetical protein
MIEDTTRGRVVLDERDRSHWLVALPFMFTIIGGALLQKTTGEFAVTPYVGQRLHLDPGLASAAWLLTGVACISELACALYGIASIHSLILPPQETGYLLSSRSSWPLR